MRGVEHGAPAARAGTAAAAAAVLAAGLLATPVWPVLCLKPSCTKPLPASLRVGARRQVPGAFLGELAACATVGTLAICSSLRAVRTLRAPPKPGVRQDALRVVAAKAFEDATGVQPPLGFWDPMGFTDDGDMAAFQRRRSVELKHGRVSMLATIGFMVPEIFGKWPGYISPSMGLKFADVPNGLAALEKMPELGTAQILIFCGLLEYTAGFEDYRTGTPGDYGWKVLTAADPTTRRAKLNAELANGRLAMVAIMAMLFQNGLAGTTGPEMWIPGASAAGLAAGQALVEARR